LVRYPTYPAGVNGLDDPVHQTRAARASRSSPVNAALNGDPRRTELVVVKTDDMAGPQFADGVS
jgi:hypothetical protein